jgi:hypothetical protein
MMREREREREVSVRVINPWHVVQSNDLKISNPLNDTSPQNSNSEVKSLQKWENVSVHKMCVYNFLKISEPNWKHTQRSRKDISNMNSSTKRQRHK